MSKIKFVLPLALLLSAVLGCQKDDVTTVGDGARKFEGWGGSPDAPNKKPFDFFYMKATGRASNKAMEKRSGAMMQTTCTDAAVTGMKGNLIGKLIGEDVVGASGTSDGESTGVVVVREFSGNLRGVNTKECKPLFEDEANTPYSGWKECECVVFVKIPGGKEAVVAKAEKNK
jgi:hypothetical protein